MILTASIFMSNSRVASAYVLNGYKLSAPQNIRYWISPTMVSNYAEVFMKMWQNCDEIRFEATASTDSTDYNVYMTAIENLDYGSYATTYHNNNNDHRIIYYAPFFEPATTWTMKYEIIVHEVGHCLGLAHCQPINNSISVMRETGFNNKAYPLSDDILGISYLY